MLYSSSLSPTYLMYVYAFISFKCVSVTALLSYFYRCAHMALCSLFSHLFTGQLSSFPVTVCFPLFIVKCTVPLVYGYEKPALSCQSFCFLTTSPTPTPVRPIHCFQVIPPS